MNFQLSEIQWLAVKVLLVYAAHLQYSTLWQGELDSSQHDSSEVMLFSGLIISPKLSLKDMIAIPISAFEPEETMFQAECEVQETYSVLIDGELDLMQNCERMMGVSYPALLDIFSISILPSLLLHIPTCQWWPALLRFTGFMEWTTQIFWTFDVVMLATQYKPPGETWLESSNHLSQDLGGHFSLAMCIKVNWYLECNRCQRSAVRHSEKNVSSCRSCHLGPYWFTTWDLEFEELSKNLLRLVVRVYCSYWQNWSCWSSYPHSRKTWFVLLGMHGLFKGLKCLSFTTVLQTPPWSSSKTGMRMALVSKNLWWPGSSFWCFRRNACCTYQHLTNCVTGCFTPRLDLVVVGPDWLLASFDEQAFIHCIFIQKY